MAIMIFKTSKCSVSEDKVNDDWLHKV